jgi:predicted transcriptional regulator of viral defense system
MVLSVRAQKTPPSDAVARARAIFRAHGGILRTAQALRAGIHPRTLYAMRDSGELERVSRGLYRLSEASPLGNPDLVAVAMKVPDAVVCLISALASHDLTTQIPHAVWIALPTGSWTPRLEQPPLEVCEFGGKTYSEGVETHELDGVPVRIYSPEKTLADCFRFRSKVGLDTALEALRAYRERRKVNVGALMHFADVCRVQRVMRPYLEALL